VRLAGIVALLAVLSLITPAPARVVVNEIFYNAPDDMDDVQWIEFYNSSDQSADLSGWTLDDGKFYTFPAKTVVAAKGFLVVALNPERFTQIYGERAIGPLRRPLKRGSERLRLKDGQGKLVDDVRYKDKPPWPVSADGYSASLERICPSASGESAENWACSPLPPTPKPSGTPGRQNACFSATLPPVVTMDAAPSNLVPGQPLRLAATAKGKVRELVLLYRVLADGSESKESALPMAKETDGRFVATIPGQTSGALVRYRVKVVGDDGSTRSCPAEHDLRPTFSAYVHDKWEASAIPFGLLLLGGPDKISTSPTQSRPPTFGNYPMTGRGPRPNLGGFGPRQEQPRPPRGASTFIFVDHQTGKTMVFDHISAVPRSNDRGFKIFFHKDHTLNNMSAVNLVFEGSGWSLMAEALSYDVYHRAGSPAPLSEFVRVWVDGRLAGHHLMVERPNRSFLRRNEIDDNGNLYKTLWTGRDPVSRHEKKTNEQSGHEDLLALLDQLGKAEGNPDDQWKVIQHNFDVEQVARYFAVNMVLSHWDGFFNNYFAYHDIERNKWQMYPWDQDKTWGYYDGLPDDQVFFDMPLTFGMAGDRPPGAQENAGAGGSGRGMRRGGFGGAIWWRQGGEFSRPLLANPQFRKLFLARTKDIVERIYTQETYFRLIDEMAARLKDDAALRAKLRGDSPEAGHQLLARDVDLLKQHLTKRRQFLLEQKELQGADGPPKPETATPASTPISSSVRTARR
jgi:spore coat protein CotH